MLFILPSCILACIACFFLGFYIRGLSVKLKKLGKLIDEKFTDPVPVVPEEPQSTIIDPNDEVQTAVYEHKKMLKMLNPDLD